MDKSIIINMIRSLLTKSYDSGYYASVQEHGSLSKAEYEKYEKLKLASIKDRNTIFDLLKDMLGIG
jgi:hypothetical protein